MLASDRLPSSFELEVKAHVGTPRAIAEVHEYRWREPQHLTYLADRHCIDMVLSHRPPAALGRFVEEGPCPPHQIGRVIFLPGGRALESEWSPGEQRSVCCTIDPGLCDDEMMPNPSGLAGALDVRDYFVQASLVRLAREALSPGFASGLVVECLCQALLVDLQRSCRACEIPQSAQRPSLDIARIDEMLDIDGPTPGTTELARRFDMSPRHFARLFRAATGQNLSAYAATFRIARARALLSGRTPMIKEVAWRSGFENAAAFAAAFRRATGLSPRQFRASQIR